MEASVHTDGDGVGRRDRGDHRALLLEGAQPFGGHAGGQVLAAFLWGDAAGAEACAGHWGAAEELIDQQAEATGDDPATADSHLEVGVLAQVGDVADAVAVGAGGQLVVLLPQAVIGR
ncbi:hypothetical protein [Streptomyces sp. NPDC018833]|uniref:hypothetical protein n=1 Tax=Streptomyces sp. NPDC018833 TaxID=3365053 RepID=UPI0037A2C3B1